MSARNAIRINTGIVQVGICAIVTGLGLVAYGLFWEGERKLGDSLGYLTGCMFIICGEVLLIAAGSSRLRFLLTCVLIFTLGGSLALPAQLAYYGDGTFFGWTGTLAGWPLMLVGILLLPIGLWSALRTRVSLGRCVKCQYDLRGSIEQGRCPECGTPIHDSRNARGILPP